MGDTRSRLVTIGIGAAILGTLVGIGHVLWTRSADSEIVHYSWPVKWALTLAAESPDLTAGSRFNTVTVRNAGAGGHWTVAGEVELPSIEGQRLVTSYAVTVSSQCPDVSERRCWAMDEFTLGSVPAAIPTSPSESPAAESDSTLEIAALAPAAVEPAPVPELVAPPEHSETEQDQDLALILTERLVEPVAPPEQPEPEQDEDLALILTERLVELAAPPEQSEPEQDEDLAFILTERLVEPADDLLLTLGGPSRIHQPHATRPQLDPVLVRDIQRGLAALGYDPGPIDGLLGRQTRAAVESFGRREGLASATIGFDLLNEITRRLSRSEPVPARVSPPSDLRQPQESQRQPLACASVSPKTRDCGA